MHERMGERERGREGGREGERERRREERHFPQAPQFMVNYREPHWVYRII